MRSADAGRRDAGQSSVVLVVRRRAQLAADLDQPVVLHLLDQLLVAQVVRLQLGDPAVRVAQLFIRINL